MRVYTDEFIFPQGKVFLRERINNEAVGESWRTFFKRLFVYQMIGEVAIEFVEAFLILCQADVGLIAAIAEINTNYRMNTCLLRSADKRKNSRRTVDVGECKGIDPLGFRIRYQGLDRHRAVFEAEVGMAVGEHGHFERREKSRSQLIFKISFAA